MSIELWAPPTFMSSYPTPGLCLHVAWASTAHIRSSGFPSPKGVGRVNVLPGPAAPRTEVLRTVLGTGVSGALLLVPQAGKHLHHKLPLNLEPSPQLLIPLRIRCCPGTDTPH